MIVYVWFGTPQDRGPVLKLDLILLYSFDDIHVLCRRCTDGCWATWFQMHANAKLFGLLWRVRCPCSTQRRFGECRQLSKMDQRQPTYEASGDSLLANSLIHSKSTTLPSNHLTMLFCLINAHEPDGKTALVCLPHVLGAGCIVGQPSEIDGLEGVKHQ